MAVDLHVQAAKTPAVSKADVYAALRSIGSDALSAESPVSAQLREAFVATRPESVTVRVEGHAGEWSQESQQTLVRTLAGIDGVDAATIEIVAGGYDETTETDEAASESGESESEEGETGETATREGDRPPEETGRLGVEEIDGVGQSRSEALRAAGIETVDDLLEAGVDGLVEEAEVSEGVAENIIEQANTTW